MTNEKVIISFLNKEKGHTPTRVITGTNEKGQTLNSTGGELINYKTVIAYWKDETLFINTTKYSSTTSHIQSKLKYLATEKGILYRTYNPKKMDEDEI